MGSSGVRKRRPDQDYIDVVTSTALQQKKARTTTDMVIADGDFGRSVGRRFVSKQLSAYWASLNLSLPASVHLSLICDGARLGNPAKENLLLAVATGSGVGYWLPQQAARRVESQLSGRCPFLRSPLSVWVVSPLSFLFRVCDIHEPIGWRMCFRAKVERAPLGGIICKNLGVFEVFPSLQIHFGTLYFRVRGRLFRVSHFRCAFC